MTEIWKDIPGYEGLYQASNLGRIKSVGRKVYNPNPSLKNPYINWPEKILQQDKSSGNKGYGRITLSKNGKTKRKMIHYWIAITFIPNPDNKPCIDHIDDNPENNNVSNLRWVSYQENNEKEHHRKELSKATTNYYKNKRKINQFSLDNILIATYDNFIEASKNTGVGWWSISNCCKGIYKTGGGFIWKYE